MFWRHFARLVRKNALLFLLVPLTCGLGATLIAYYQFISSDKTLNSYYGYKQSITASLGAYAPYAFMEKGGMLDGYIIQLTRAIGRETRVRIDVVSRKLDDTQEAAIIRDVDVVLCMVKTPRAKQAFDFTKPYAVNALTLIKRKSAPAPVDYHAELEKGRFVFNADGVYHDLYGADLKNVGSAPTAEDALRLIDEGAYDYTILENYIAQRVLGMLNLDNVEIVGETNELVEYAFAVRKTKPDLFRIFANGLHALQDSGEFDKIQSRWVEERFLISKSARNTILTSIMIGAGISLAVLVLFFLWTSMLQEEIGLRTAELSSEIDVRKRTEAQLLANQAQLIQADKLAAIGTLASGIAHEINNPNGLLSMNISFLKRLSGDFMQTLEDHRIEPDTPLAGIPYGALRAHLPALLADMEGASTRIGEIVDDLKDFARPDSTRWGAAFSIDDPTRTALRLLEHTIRKATDHLEVDLAAETPKISGSPQKIEQVLINLIVNACQALQRRDRGLFISTRWEADTDEIVFVIRDEGCGIPEENLPLLRDPFFTTKRESGGTGLGLSISDTIVKAHGGSMTIDSALGVGTTVTLRLPVEKRKENHEKES
ncbi:MAG: transporter substrate-binding domain-containing protein [Phyllobacteriaceae bacterium]|nr:transporter substrate-binding domain-containing protein [Phyllobacteriaceae bacterium]